jgi:hypothetical protein
MFKNIYVVTVVASVFVALTTVQNIVHAVSGGGTGAPACPIGQICNPIKSQSISEFLLKIIDVLLVFALPIIILYIMYAGYLFVTAAGNSEKVASAKNALLWSVVGGVIALGAKLIIEVIQGTVAAF